MSLWLKGISEMVEPLIRGIRVQDADCRARHSFAAIRGDLMNPKLIWISAVLILFGSACADDGTDVREQEGMVCSNGAVGIDGCPPIDLCHLGNTGYFVIEEWVIDFVYRDEASFYSAADEAAKYCEENNLDPDVTESMDIEDRDEVSDEGTDAGPTCDDKIRNGSESDVDCGGSCYACADGKTCVEGPDCESGSCNDGTCVCVPVCTCGGGKDYACGSDSCGGYCGYGCGEHNSCWNHECKPDACGPVCDQLVAVYGCEGGCESHGVDDGYGGTTSCYCRKDYCAL